MLCKDCIFYDSDSDGKSGFCRRNPPQVFLVGAQSLAGTYQPAAVAVWPNVHGLKDWCGQGELKPS